LIDCFSQTNQYQRKTFSRNPSNCNICMVSLDPQPSTELTYPSSGARLTTCSTDLWCSMTSLSIRSFAKLNIALDVLDKRPDGYHNIASVIQPISLHDVLTVSKNDGEAVSVWSSDSAVPRNERNLAYRAAVLFLEASGLTDGIDMEIEKRIPMEAGLGGGSSNAAAALVALNRLFGEPLSTGNIQRLCAELGSDVPFFLVGGTAFAEGRGETLTGLPDIPLDFVVIKPEFGISTAWAYKTLSGMERPRRQFSRRVADSIREGSRDGVVAGMGNDFEMVADSEFSEIAAIRASLMDSGADGAMLAGSGSAVFGVFPDSRTCDSAYHELEERYPRCFRARTMLQEELTTREFVTQ
jgi:4-diphosphocytidyl-2-C-methyl-D-erythritol kinase